MRKCDMCYERQSQGKPTACAEACPVGATISGERDDLLAEAQKRIAEKPADYYHKIYGVEEVGGTSVLYLSAVPFEQIGLRTNLPQGSHCRRPPGGVLELVPDVVSTGSVLLGGIWWITNRRAEVAERKGRRQMKVRLTQIHRIWRAIFAAIMCSGLYATYLRVFYGLGGSTNLSDQFPWGIWIGFRRDVRRGPGGGRLHAGGDGPHLQHRKLQADAAAGDSDGVPRLLCWWSWGCCSTWAVPTVCGIRW